MRLCTTKKRIFTNSLRLGTQIKIALLIFDSILNQGFYFDTSNFNSKSKIDREKVVSNHDIRYRLL